MTWLTVASTKPVLSAPIPVALAVVGEKGAIALDIGVKLLHSLQQFPGCGIACGSHGHVEIHHEVGELLERFILDDQVFCS